MGNGDFVAAQQRIFERQCDRQVARELYRNERAPRQMKHLPFPLQSILTSVGNVWDVIKGREGTHPSLRVGQLDAELLDQELLGLLKGQVTQGLAQFGSHIAHDWSAEISLILRAILFKLSIWDKDATYGASLQGLRYCDGRARGPVPKPPSTWQKALYGLIGVGGEYAWAKWEDILLDTGTNFLNDGSNFSLPTPRPSQQRVGALRRLLHSQSSLVRSLGKVTSWLSNMYSIAALLSFLAFLATGQHRSLLDRLLRLRLIPPPGGAGAQRHAISFEYQNRQLVWHAFTEFLLFLLPLIGIKRWRRWLTRLWTDAKRAVLDSGSDKGHRPAGELAFLPDRTCPICYQDQTTPSITQGGLATLDGQSFGAGGGVVGSAETDVTNPYEAIECGCIYCYVCLTTRLASEEGEGFECLRCETLVKSCRPWRGDVLEIPQKARSTKFVSFEDDVEDAEEDSADGGDAMATVEPRPESDFAINHVYSIKQPSPKAGDAHDSGYFTASADENGFEGKT